MRLILRCQCWRRAGKKKSTERPDGCKHPWHTGFKDGVFIPIRTPFWKRVDAERYAEKWRANYFKRKAGLPTEPMDDEPETRRAETVRLTDLRTRFNAWIVGELPKTAPKYLRVVDQFVDIVGPDTLLHTIEASHIEQYRSARREQIASNGRGWQTKKLTTPKVVSRQTINTNMTALRTFFRQAFLWYGHKNPFTPIFLNGRMRSPIPKYKIASTEKKAIVPLSAEEVAAVTAALPDPYGLICRITYQVLARIGEVTRLRPNQIGIVERPDGSRHGWMQRDLKGGDNERIRIPLALAEELLDRIDALPPKATRIFHTVKPEYASSKLRQLFNALGKPYSHHWFRHSGITSMKDAGTINDAAIVALAGWSTPAQLATYNHVSDRAVAHAGDEQARLLAAAQQKRGKVIPIGTAAR